MSKILKRLPSHDDAKRYRELERQARQTAASVLPLYKQSFLRMAYKWRLLAESAERRTGRPVATAKRDVVLD